jgi:hypothetical protein
MEWHFLVELFFVFFCSCFSAWLPGLAFVVFGFLALVAFGFLALVALVALVAFGFLALVVFGVYDL